MRYVFEFLHFLGLSRPQAVAPPPINPNRLYVVAEDTRFFVVETDYFTVQSG